ncbi:electron transfer flavoprotein subunit alpha/FixB family protein [Gluconacetobacter sacchari]|uniref:Electron transfer flavoprotein subunit alpha/FixB family protein n=2 Tax=Gluconacetobacter sacchari TaxID=92759 RepID=A0A7W4I9B6_9PROT|nr:electron transfer flavoprotein subunit alpha/FixB family protein [Gluconacetobacter sacchari]MBB2158599.1 electron transfer flavoprotein subunit alpha/FixB family protein [Gluconacetobacter sacchari]GBQ26538.1 electron transfer flavoprotein subunit alpha [Gluconacetobacter sacchari DSM 12717]
MRARRDPRAERARCLVPGGARPRLARAGEAVVGAGPRERAVISIEAPAFWVAVVVEAPDGRLDRWARQSVGAARVLAGAEGGVVALLAGTAGGDALGEAGADRVVPLDGGIGPDAMPEMMLAALAPFVPRHVVLAETPAGGDWARRLAARAGWPIQTGVEMLSARQAIRPVGGMRRERAAAPARVLTLPRDRVASHGGTRREGRWCPAPERPADRGRMRVGPVVTATAAGIPLAEAPFVMAAGQGVVDFERFHALSRLLGATEGASRVVCDAGLMPRAAQVGASGTVLDARCYLAFGIAGAPQHLQGLGKVEHVVAVNTDLHAAIVARAGLSIIADAQAVMPALLDLLREEG